ncbi:hypothetical protein Q31b_05210 [Novipirellula aureliae]|uniref:Uncharacterized protein n=1 Tax=Novipirellula aureliae TaxID=2527966 RepID=A0A5C6EDQ0_9BACT|nr:hypothetical protein Q31b_05210 [Novipirellula aureliae]
MLVASNKTSNKTVMATADSTGIHFVSLMQNRSVAKSICVPLYSYAHFFTRYNRQLKNIAENFLHPPNVAG